MMKTLEEIKAEIASVEKAYAHVLTGTLATLHINAPRALMQLEAEARLATLHWVIGTKYVSRLKSR